MLVQAFFGYGYISIQDSIVSFKCGEAFYGEGDSGIRYDDPEIGGVWTYELVGGPDEVKMSERDKSLMTFAEYRDLIGEQTNVE